MVDLPFRQIHLDFHTSADIPDVASEFSANEFARTLERACVNSVTAFAKCHHGMSYYDTKVGVKHPSLKIDLLGEMVEACHARKIRVPAYISVSWDEWSARNHPEWSARDREGKMWIGGPLQATWHAVCMLNDDYQKYLLAQTKEVLKNYEVDGLFMDIFMTPSPACFCWSCLEKMQKEAVDPLDDNACRAFNEDQRTELMEKISALAQKLRPDATVFYNGCLRIGKSDWFNHFTHIEIESLPTGGWGYGHYPLFARYYRNFGLQTLGMTARFHRTWGDFGGLKNRAALEFECFSMLAAGSHCSVGDQMHPRGRLDTAVYDLIGSVYNSVLEKEPWCAGGKHVAQAAILHAEGLDTAVHGAVRMLLENHELFDVVDANSDFLRYEVLILPDGVRLDGALAKKLSAYLADDGALLLSGESGLKTDQDKFALEELSVKYRQKAEFDPNFICEIASPMSRGIPEFNYMMYRGGHYVEAQPGVQVLARIGLPYFNRTYAHYCSHGPTPFDRVSEYPAVVRDGRVVYFAHPIFSIYAEQGARVYRQLVANALELLRPRKFVRASLPSTARIGLHRQPDKGRLVLHVLNYVAERRVQDIDIIEEAQPLKDVQLSVLTLGKPKAVYAAPDRTRLVHEYEDEYTTVTIPSVDGHAMVVFEGVAGVA